MNKKISSIICLILILTLWFVPDLFSQAKSDKRPPAPVYVESVEARKISQTSILVAVIKPHLMEYLSVDDSGRIKNINKTKGDLVEKGELLAEVANPIIKSNLINADVTLKESLITLKQLKKRWIRTRGLTKKKLATAQQLDDDLANYSLQRVIVDKRKNEVQKLTNVLDSFQVKAPFDGQIIDSNVERGQWVTPSQNLYVIVNYQNFEVELGVPGRYAGKVIIQSPVEAVVKETGLSLDGRITAVSHHVEESTGNFLVKIIFPNPGADPISGLLAEVYLPIGLPSDQLLISRDAVVRKARKTYVVLVEKGLSKIVPVQVNGSQKDKVIIQADGIKEGDQVIVRGNERLFPGTPVEVKTAR
ncbi:MAG: efflux RND transporter periplasmic adaptor subunit [Deltaproteobacteria bacterium]|nr:efflux RND transporter periplasmic adaptor subunit [Deltaproteobacteria bacterium]